MYQILKQLNRQLAQSIGVSAYFRANFCEALISCFVRIAIRLPGGRPEALKIRKTINLTPKLI